MSDYKRVNRFGQKVRKRTFEFPEDLLVELKETSQKTKRPEVELVVEAVREKIQSLNS